jgi:hypothetical protein
MKILEVISSPEWLAAAEQWKAARLEQMDNSIILHDKLLELEREDRDELAELFGKDLAWAFGSQSKKQLAEVVNRLPPAKRITQYWDWDRWLQKIW